MSDTATREMIQAELGKVPDESLDELYGIVRQFANKPKEGGAGVLSKLASIRIQGPRDFAANLDQYLSGEKRLEDDLP